MAKKRIKTSKEIGAKIKRRRREIGISQEQLAETLGVTYQQVQRYENGMNKLNVENIQIIADALSVPVSYFFEPDKTLMIAGKITPYLTAEDKLLKHFRKITNNNYKNIVIQIARIAAKAD